MKVLLKKSPYVCVHLKFQYIYPAVTINGQDIGLLGADNCSSPWGSVIWTQSHFSYNNCCFERIVRSLCVRNSLSGLEVCLDCFVCERAEPSLCDACGPPLTAHGTVRRVGSRLGERRRFRLARSTKKEMQEKHDSNAPL